MESTAVQENPVIRKIMEKESAIAVLNEIKDRIGGADLTNICGDEVDVTPNDIQEATTRRVIQAIQCGLVYFDERENCLVQRLIRPLKSGELTAEELKYKHRLNLTQLKAMNAANELDLLEKVLSQVSGRPPQLIGQLKAQDIEVATGCLVFFDK